MALMLGEGQEERVLPPPRHSHTYFLPPSFNTNPTRCISQAYNFQKLTCDN
jgi:hypothetical protein